MVECQDPTIAKDLAGKLNLRENFSGNPIECNGYKYFGLPGCGTSVCDTTAYEFWNENSQETSGSCQ